MAKNLLFALLICTHQFGLTPIFASNALKFTENARVKPNNCVAPAPDSFQVTSINSETVTLGWIPAWADANYTLEISVEDSGNWILLSIYDDVPGESYTLIDLESGYYRVSIATKCHSGETSVIFSEVVFRYKIIDLTTDGRMPKNPISVEDCNNIDFMNHEWVGFEVTETATGISNLFEFKPYGSNFPEIKRVVYDHNIVAVDEDGTFPSNQDPYLDTRVPFLINAFVDGDFFNIGFVECHISSSSPPTMALCNIEFHPLVNWKPGYKFKALTAESVVVDYPNGVSFDKTFQDTIKYYSFRAQSPFKENLNIFAPNTDLSHCKTEIRLVNANGQKILEKGLDFNAPQISFQFASLLPGIYFLQIETNNKVQTLKVVKSD